MNMHNTDSGVFTNEIILLARNGHFIIQFYLDTLLFLHLKTVIVHE